LFISNNGIVHLKRCLELRLRYDTRMLQVRDRHEFLTTTYNMKTLWAGNYPIAASLFDKLCSMETHGKKQ
jgi:hypothetical protein